jgi:hypothetical protein
MTHQINDISQEFDAKSFFTKARKLYVETPLKELGFRKYKSSVIARLTSGDVFQFLDFQKAAYGGQSFTINVAIRPLFCQNYNYLILNPGNRLGNMSKDYKRDKWWYYKTKEEGNKSFIDVFNQIEKYVIPFFEATMSSEEIISSYQKNIFGISKFGDRVSWGTIGNLDFELGHIYLHTGQINKAINHFDACYKEFKKDDRGWAQNKASECLKINNIITSGQPHIDKYISDTIKNSKENLNLLDW